MLSLERMWSEWETLHDLMRAHGGGGSGGAVGGRLSRQSADTLSSGSSGGRSGGAASPSWQVGLAGYGDSPAAGGLRQQAGGFIVGSHGAGASGGAEEAAFGPQVRRARGSR